MEQARKKAGTGYRTLKVEERSAFGSDKTMWSHFAYLTENDSNHGELMPTLLRGVDVVVSSGGSPSYTVRATWPAGAKDDAILNLIQSVRLAK